MLSVACLWNWLDMMLQMKVVVLKYLGVREQWLRNWSQACPGQNPSILNKQLADWANAMVSKTLPILFQNGNIITYFKTFNEH